MNFVRFYWWVNNCIYEILVGARSFCNNTRSLCITPCCMCKIIKQFDGTYASTQTHSDFINGMSAVDFFLCCCCCCGLLDVCMLAYFIGKPCIDSWWGMNGPTYTQCNPNGVFIMYARINVILVIHRWHRWWGKNQNRNCMRSIICDVSTAVALKQFDSNQHKLISFEFVIWFRI